jgi:hypothetical protein
MPTERGLSNVRKSQRREKNQNRRNIDHDKQRKTSNGSYLLGGSSDYVFCWRTQAQYRLEFIIYKFNVNIYSYYLEFLWLVIQKIITLYSTSYSVPLVPSWFNKHFLSTQSKIPRRKSQ